MHSLTKNSKDLDTESTDAAGESSACGQLYFVHPDWWGADGRRWAVTGGCGRSHQLAVVGAEKLDVTARIEARKRPWRALTWPRATGSLDQP
ncbi:MAG: hypothetical protein Q8Q80_09790 [Methyloversatilis sp.]|uniref:hypothetical protein n=1 Tax=Methyloversatilis sp. TaxID=2569862 RepID=UPI0027375ABF|nr:hypothetical protein [Methyloversatilis sp.]MDP3872945.1 hypothetical protein [Methyloversatilis sp.]